MPVAHPGPSLSRADLEAGASGSITRIFGPAFADHDAWDRVVRMPEPPLLLADRVLGIEGPPRVLGKGTIWTETDVREDGWYLHDGRMPGGVLIECGQADLLLVSWQGIDTLNRSERIYRLLGCTLTLHRDLPRPGETLRYDIHVDGHARLGDVRMFFFHYDCHVGSERQISIREGQAGFFSDAELAESGGVLWDAATAEVDLTLPHAATPPARPTQTVLDRPALEALADGRVADCFGPSHVRAHTHTHTPRIAAGRMLFLDRVTLDLEGGPWGRGYLRAEQDIRPDLWFFDGHFKNDPCMPGTLMFDACLQAMQVYLTGLGYTLGRDAWRFQPATEVPFKLRCRGQVLPTAKTLVYEIFVQAVVDGVRPRLHAQVLATVDGLKCFHADPIVLELVPDWPMSRMPPPALTRAPGEVPYDWPQLLACAWGRPSDAFGPLFARYDSGERSPRLPGPPYHFMTRVTHTEGTPGGLKAGGAIDVEYDVPPDAWYFAETGGTMPFAVLLEAALQPCGWLASWTGGSLATEGEVLFRNLDGTATWHAEVKPDAGMLRTRTHLTRLSRSAGMVIVGFDVTMTQGGRPLYDLKTVFGFFPPAAFANQAGVGSTPADLAWLAEPSSFHVDLRERPPAWFGGTAHLPAGKLLMLDRVTGYWPGGGRAGLGKWRAEKDVDPQEWMFKAHFFQDPVQPGSLGLEALVQLLQVHLLHTGVARPGTRFEPLAMGVEMTWKYRGQVTPDARLVQAELEITRVDGDLVVADGHLWVDGKRIYSTSGLGMRVVPADPAPRRTGTITLPVPEGHAPTYVLPALPMTGMAMVALAAANATSLVDGVARRWLVFPDGPRTVQVTVDGAEVRLTTAKDPHGRGGSGHEVFTARIAPVPEPPPPAALVAPTPGPSGAELYASGALFHDGAFRVVDRVVATGRNGATLLLHPAPPDRLLDGATHGIPHDRLDTLDASLPGDRVGYPARLRSLALYGAPPAGPVRCEVRLLGVEGGRPRFGAWFYAEERLAAWYELEEVLLPKGRLGSAPSGARRDFLLGRAVSDVSLARLGADEATLTAAEVAASDWLPGTIERVYGTRTAPAIAARELEGARLHVHPRFIATEPAAGTLHAWDRHHPLRTRALRVEGDTVRGGPERFPDLDGTLRWWRRSLECGPWPGEDVLVALTRAGLADLHVEDPDAFEALRGTPCLYLANHETYVESAVFTCVVSALQGVPVHAVAKLTHADGWLGKLHAALVDAPLAHFPGFIRYFDQSDPGSLPGILEQECRSTSLLVHVDGTRQTRSGEPVEKMSSVWVDLATERGVPIVPVAFRGGVRGAKVDFPVGPQDVHLGTPILPAELTALPYAERRRRVMEAINRLPSRAPAGACPWEGVAPLPGVAAAIRAEVPNSMLARVLGGAAPPPGPEAAWYTRFRDLTAG